MFLKILNVKNVPITIDKYKVNPYSSICINTLDINEKIQKRIDSLARVAQIRTFYTEVDTGNDLENKPQEPERPEVHFSNNTSPEPEVIKTEVSEETEIKVSTQTKRKRSK